MKARGVADLTVATLDLLLYVNCRTDMVHFWIGALPSALHEINDSLVVCWIFKDPEVILKLRLRPNGDISHVGLGEKVEELGEGSWEDVSDLASSVPNL